MSDLNGPSEPVPNQLRILAAQENLGTLISIHRPATWFARRVLKASRVYLFDRGFVLSNGRGALGLFLADQVTVTEKAGTWLVTRQDGARFRLTRHWTEYRELGRRLSSR
ncbi:MAG TPA: hypothetical protein VFN97_04680 [Actinospica sp.]|nr:hypothetical protein [Actinospica sp.]